MKFLISKVYSWKEHNPPNKIISDVMYVTVTRIIQVSTFRGFFQSSTNFISNLKIQETSEEAFSCKNLDQQGNSTAIKVLPMLPLIFLVDRTFPEAILV